MAIVVSWCLRRVSSKASLSLVILVIQNSLLVIMTRFSRSNVLPEDNYYTSTLILNQEVVKMVMCLVIFAYDEAGRTSAAKQSATTTTVAVSFEAESPTDGGAASPVLSTRAAGGPAGQNTSHLGSWPAPAKAACEVVDVTGDEVAEHEVRLLKDDHKELRGKLLPPQWRCLPRLLSPLQLFRQLRTSIFKKDTILLLFPQVLFTMQNFLIFVALSNLDAVSFQIWSQTKLLSAALFSVWLLQRRLSWVQWFSLALLTFGVLVTQLNSPTTVIKADNRALLRRSRGKTRKTTTTTTTTTLPGMDEDVNTGNALLGITACVLSGLSSSYAGVYFEKVVKTTSPTLAIRNIQLSLFGIPLAIFSMMVLDVLPNWQAQSYCGQPLHWNIFFPPPQDWRERAAAAGSTTADVSCPVKPFFFWQHYDAWLTWGLVGIHALGGLLVAIVVRYADNILKGFATGIAVIASGLMSSVIWNYKPTLQFVLGGLLVTASTIVFHKFELKK